MSYPLYAELYEVNGAIYRRPPYRGDTTQMNQLPTGAGDTADLYDDDDYEEECGYNDDGPACGVGEIPAEPEVAKPESSKPARSFAPPPGFNGPPPGLAAPPAKPVTTIPRVAPNAVATADPRVMQEGEKRWTASIEVARNLHGILIGAKHALKTEMETATQCRIIFPSKDSTGTTIRIVSSAGQENVSRCLDRIDATILAKEKSGQISKNKTHFAAIPCNDPVVRQRFQTFKDMVLTSSDIHPSCHLASLFPSMSKLHLTVCMLQLQTDQEKDLARKAMATVKEKFSKRAPLEVRIEGLDMMTDDPSAVHVLFAKVHGDGVQQLVNDVKSEFDKAGLVSRDEKKIDVKLHMTVMNSRYAATDDNNDYNFKNRKTFDARSLLREHGDFEFGRFKLDRINICTLSTEDKETGYYECFADERIA